MNQKLKEAMWLPLGLLLVAAVFGLVCKVGRPERYPPLHRALLQRNAAETERLLRRGADLNATAEGMTPLRLAVRTGQPEAVAMLLDRGAKMEAEDGGGVALLSEAGACAHGKSDGYLRVMEMLLARGVAANGSVALTTPLLVAASADDPRVVKLLLAHGAEVNARNGDGWTPLMKACWLGCTENVKLLLAAGAATEVAIAGGSLKPGYTALHFAANGGETEIVRLLLEAGAEANARDSENATPLRIAKTREVAALLIAHGAEVNTRDNDGWTPLMRAAGLGDLEWVELLLAHGAEAKARNEDGWTALHNAAVKGHSEIVRVLLSAGAQVNATRATDGATPLRVARNVEVAELLRSHGGRI